MKKRSRILPGIVFLLVIFLLSGFQKTYEREWPEQAKQLLTQRFDELVEARLNRCAMQAVQKARHDVDSLLISYQRLVEIDTFKLAPRPSKPLKPQFRSETDSLGVKPLLRDSQTELNEYEFNNSYRH